MEVNPPSLTAAPPGLEAALARLEANADLDVQVQGDLWCIAREYRALRERTAALAEAVEEAAKLWEIEDRGDAMAPMDSAMYALEAAFDDFCLSPGVRDGN
jgi:hypothetical protein